ncbi:N-acetylmuramoyl-L-alanine amidase [Halomonas huangheensis]|nr:N-acetylmuramoyl-L-alanine amidase [Halomonas huangheensis]
MEARDGYVVDHRQPARSQESRIRYVVLHYTDENLNDSLRILTGPHVSSHYLVPLPLRQMQGQPVIHQLVDESRRAWHAGSSYWRGHRYLNDTSIGIEIVNAGPDGPWQGGSPEPRQADWAPYPENQTDALISLLHDLIRRHDLDPEDILAHSDIAPHRKLDPGPAFPWQQLHEAGIGAWPQEQRVAVWLARFSATPPGLEQLQQALAAWGYELTANGVLDDDTTRTLRAFQMHFRPSNYRGQPDAETAAILWALLERYHPDQLAELSPTLTGR